MVTFRSHAVAPAAAIVCSPLSAAQTAAAAVEGRPGGPVADHFSRTEGCSPRLAQVTTAAADMLEGLVLSIAEGCSPRSALVATVAADMPEELAVPDSSVATDRLPRSMGSVGWPPPLRWKLRAVQFQGTPVQGPF